MTDSADRTAIFAFDAETRALVRLAARIAAGSELDVREGVLETQGAGVSALWVEEMILQSYLFAGFPRALNAMREYRMAGVGVGAGLGVQDGGTRGGRGEGTIDYRALGEATCARVYGKHFDKLRHNITQLHPELDDWMIVEGYGKVLSRPGLDLGRRELCTVAACVATGQDRQLHSHLHGARNVGVPDDVIALALDALDGVVDAAHLARAKGRNKTVDGGR